MAEAISVIGLIGAIINIAEAIKETYATATEANRLPRAFGVVSERISVVQRTLSILQTNYRGTEDESAIRESFLTCKENAESLKFIFEQVCPVEGEGILRKYRKALSSLKPGRSEKVENLFKEILDTLQTLQAFHIFKNLIPIEDLMDAIKEIDEVNPSLPESPATTINSWGTGAMFNSGPGELRVKQQNGDGNYQAETMNFAAPAGTTSVFIASAHACELIQMASVVPRR